MCISNFSLGEESLVKSIPGINFINILWAAFTHKDPKSVQKIDNLTACIKAACRMLMKLTPVVNFINFILANFLYERHFSSYVLALSKNLYKIFARLTLMKLTPGEDSYDYVFKHDISRGQRTAIGLLKQNKNIFFDNFFFFFSIFIFF